MHAIQGVLPACCQIKVQKRRVSYFSSTPVAAEVVAEVVSELIRASRIYCDERLQVSVDARRLFAVAG